MAFLSSLLSPPIRKRFHMWPEVQRATTQVSSTVSSCLARQSSAAFYSFLLALIFLLLPVPIAVTAGGGRGGGGWPGRLADKLPSIMAVECKTRTLPSDLKRPSLCSEPEGWKHGVRFLEQETLFLISSVFRLLQRHITYVYSLPWVLLPRA
jgi:hypothetical protein